MKTKISTKNYYLYNLIWIFGFMIFLSPAFSNDSESASCNSYPVIICPDDAQICPGQSTHPKHTGWAKAKPGSGYCPDPYLYYYDYEWDGKYCSGYKSIKRIWKAKYGHQGYSWMISDCTQMIYYADHDKPHVKYCPGSNDIHYDGHYVTWKEPVFWDECDHHLYTWSSHKNGSHFPYGKTQVTYYAKDHCGNVAKCWFWVEVKKSSHLTVECPDDIYLDCVDHHSYYDLPKPKYKTDCDKCGHNIHGFVYMGHYNGHDYYCSKYKDYWHNAYAKCHGYGGYLAVIEDKHENDYLAGLLNISSAFIGLSDEDQEGIYKWSNGDSMGYSNWDHGQPNNQYGMQDYVELKRNGYWNDDYYFKKKEFILEIPCVNITKTIETEHDDYHSSGKTKVTYKVEDRCGNVKYCDFYIYGQDGLKLDCPDDIHVESAGEQTFVNWEFPTAQTCCKYCDQSGHYSNSHSDYYGYQFLGEYNGHSYYLSQSATTWPYAKHLSESKGGYLVAINDAGENEFLKHKIHYQSVYIGLSDKDSEGHFKWVNGDPLTYTNWAYGQPNNYNDNQDYVELKYDGTWNDQYNFKKLKFIMEVPSCVQIKQIAGPSLSGSGSYFPNGSTEVSFKAWDPCGNEAYCSFYVHVNGQQQQDYCSSYGENSNHYWIDKVKFGDIYNDSGNNGGYEYFDSECRDFKREHYYLMQLYPDQQYGYHDKIFWKIFADWNGNGNFSDPGEFVGYGAAHGAISGIIKIPSSASTGQTRVRIIMGAGSPPPGPCGKYAYGETEDYCINIYDHGYIKDEDSNNKNFQSGTVELKPIPESTEIGNDGLILDGEAIQNTGYSLQVYPNPTSDYLYIDQFGQNIESVSIFDLSGRKVYEMIPDSYAANIRLDVGKYNPGLYLLRVKYDDGNQDVTRFGIQR